MPNLALHGGPKAITTPLPTWPQFDDTERKALLDSLNSGKWWLYAFGGGPRPDGATSQDIAQVELLEREFAAAHHLKHCYGVSTGTAALELALKACNIGPGDEVITTAYTFIATTSAIVSRFALPVYVDIDPITYNIDPTRIEAAITPRTKAIEVVHLGGEICDMDAILAIAKRHNLLVIEDAAQAVGSILTGNRGAGGIGDVGAYSFQGSKVITAGEGGACVTQNDEIAERLWSYRNCGRSRTGVWYEHIRFGTNNRMPEFAGAILRCQLARLVDQCKTRRRNYDVLISKMKGIPGIIPRPLRTDSIQHPVSVVIFTFTGEGWDGVSRDQMLKAVQAEGLPATLGYGWANYRNAAFANLKDLPPNEKIAFGRDHFPDVNECIDRCPNTEAACSQRAIFMPHALLMGNDRQLQQIADAFTKVYENRHELGAPAGAKECSHG